MELFDRADVESIVSHYGVENVIDWRIQKLTDKLIGYLGEHLKLVVYAEVDGVPSQYNLFVKCIPREDQWKANYIRQLGFFRKEFVMLSQLFNHFGGDHGPHRWRPKLLFVRDEIFVFEDLTTLGYSMPDHTKTLTYNQLAAVVEALAKFHAQSYIYEEKRSKHLQRTYRIWEDFSETLKEPMNGMNWRNAGRNAAIDLLKTFSKHIERANFSKEVEFVVTLLFDRALELMKPTANFRNVVVHRDLWTNNIFLKERKDGSYHAMLIDYQTVLYTSPMLDLASLIYFNTTKKFREAYFESIFDTYYNVLAEELSIEGINVGDIFSKNDLLRNYEDSLVFGITQAAIIVPIIALENEKRDRIFCDPKTCEAVNEVSRSKELISVALEDDPYRQRVMELLEEIIERFCQ